MWLSSYPKFTVLLLPASIVDVPTRDPLVVVAGNRLHDPRDSRENLCCLRGLVTGIQPTLDVLDTPLQPVEAVETVAVASTSDERRHLMFHRGHAALDFGSVCCIQRVISITRFSVSSVISVLPQDPLRTECITSRKAPRPRALARMALKQRRSELESTGRVSNYRPSNDRFPVVLHSTPV